MFPKLLTAAQMARRLKVTALWLTREAHFGRIPNIDADGRYLFNPDAVIDALLIRASATPKPSDVVCDECGQVMP